MELVQRGAGHAPAEDVLRLQGAGAPSLRSEGVLGAEFWGSKGLLSLERHTKLLSYPFSLPKRSTALKPQQKSLTIGSSALSAHRLSGS